jgi:hypothetical protein
LNTLLLAVAVLEETRLKVAVLVVVVQVVIVLALLASYLEETQQPKQD